MNQSDAITRACSILFEEGQVVELRALRKKGVSSGYYTDYKTLAKDAMTLDNTPGYLGIYITLNEVNPDLLARRANRIEMNLSNQDKTTADKDIIRRRWFLIDIDPKRPSGISSSDEEHAKALQKSEAIRTFLTDLGWPEPLWADSGNGAHLLYRLDLPNDRSSTELVKNCLSALASFFSDESCDVDTSVYNAGRIVKLYGTFSKKGDRIPGRPYRRSHILSCPESVTVVSEPLLTRLAGMAPQPEVQTRPKAFQTDVPSDSHSKIDLAVWLSEAGITYSEKPYVEGRLFVLDQCPFSSAHKDGAYAIQFTNGAIFAGCHHNSCGAREQRWSDLKAMFNTDTRKAITSKSGHIIPEEYEARRKKRMIERARARSDYYGDGRQNAELGNLSLESELTNQTIVANQILRERDPIQYILDSFATDHEGDGVVAQCLIMSFASRKVINSNGLHVLVTGESGKGKSHAFDTMIQHIPPECRLDGRLSDKALFYAEDLREGSAICLDDVGLSEKMQETLKGVTTSFKKPFIYRTVNTDRKGQTCTIPARCVWWVAKVEGSGDDQVWNRMLTCWIDDSIEQDNRVLERELDIASHFPTIDEGNRFEVLVCHEIWNHLVPVHVVIPYSKQIRFSSSSNRRNPGMLLDLIKSIACIHQFQRERKLENGTEVIFANSSDFRYASEIYHALNGESGSQISKLTRSESELIQAIQRSGRYEFSMNELQNLIDKSYNSVWKLLKGSSSHQTHYSGLLEKCPAISVLDRTDVTDGGDTSRRQKVYTWDPDRYEAWAAGGGCWLDCDKDTGGSDDNCGNCNTLRSDCETLPQQNKDHVGTNSENNIYNNNFSDILQKLRDE